MGITMKKYCFWQENRYMDERNICGILDFFTFLRVKIRGFERYRNRLTRIISKGNNRTMCFDMFYKQKFLCSLTEEIRKSYAH